MGPAYVGHKRMKPSDITETVVNGKTVKVVGRSVIWYRIGGQDMKRPAEVSPDVEGSVLGKDWWDGRRYQWNPETGWVHEDSLVGSNVFRIECDLNATLVHRVPEPSEGPESEQPGAVGVVTTRQGSEGALADPESSSSDVTDSPPKSDYEEEAESESSDRDMGEFGPPDSPRGSISVPVPVVQFDQMDDSDDPASVPAETDPEPMMVVPYDPDVVVKEEVEEVKLEPELTSPDEQGQPPPLHELSQGNAMAAFTAPAEPDRDDMFTRQELIAA